MKFQQKTVIAAVIAAVIGSLALPAYATYRDEPNQCTVHDDGSRDFDNEGAARNYLQNNPNFTNNVSVRGGPNINNNSASAAATAMANGGAVSFWGSLSQEQRQALMANQSFMGSLDANQRQALQNYSPSSSSSSLALQNAFSNYSPSSATIQGNMGGQSIGNYMEGSRYYNVSLGTANGAVELPALPPTKANETFLCYAPGKIVNVPMEFAVTGRLGGVEFVRAEMDDGTRWYQSDAENAEIRKKNKGTPNVLMTQEWEVDASQRPEEEVVTIGNDKFTIKWGIGLIQRVVDVGAAINGQLAGSLFSKGDGGQFSGGGGSNIQQTVMRLTPTGDSCIMNRTRYERWLKLRLIPRNTPPAPKLVEVKVPYAVYFDHAKDTLTAQSRADLDRVVTAAKTAKAINATGHADRTKLVVTYSNQALSQRRVDAVKSYLVAQGISADIISVVAKGDAASNASMDCKGTKLQAALEACLWQHRRVDIEVVHMVAAPAQPEKK